MKRIYIVLAALLLCVSAIGQETLFSASELPNMRRFLPPPPDTASAAFRYDQAQYRWGKEQRDDSARCALAREDAEWSVDYMCRVMGGAMGIVGLIISFAPAVGPSVSGIITGEKANDLYPDYPVVR